MLPLDFSKQNLDSITTPRHDRCQSFETRPVQVPICPMQPNFLYSGKGTSEGSSDFWSPHRQEQGSSRRLLHELSNALAEKNSLVQELSRRLTRMEECLAENVQSMQREVQDTRLNDKWVSSGPGYIVVLINGNDMMPDDRFLKHATAGAREFIDILTNTAVSLVFRDVVKASQVAIHSRIFVDMTGMMTACSKSEAAPSAECIEEFGMEFNRRHSLCDFIDMGSTDNITDEKILCLLPYYLEDPNCHHVFLGCRLESPIVAWLEEDSVQEVPWVVNRTTLIDKTSFDGRSALSAYRRHDFSSIFVRRNRNVADCNGQNGTSANSTKVSDAGSDVQASVRTSVVGLEPIKQQSKPRVIIPEVNAGPRMSAKHSTPSLGSAALTTVTSPALEAVPQPSGKWSAIARNAVNLPYKDITRPAASADTKGLVVLFNSEGRRLDPKLDYDADKVSALKKMRYCNQHYIGKGCCHYDCGNSNCPHYHEDVLSPEDKKWLRVVARETVCKKGTWCNDPDCFYGHHCPYPKVGDGLACVNGHECRFKHFHGMDLKVAKQIPAATLRRA